MKFFKISGGAVLFTVLHYLFITLMTVAIAILAEIPVINKLLLLIINLLSIGDSASIIYALSFLTSLVITSTLVNKLYKNAELRQKTSKATGVILIVLFFVSLLSDITEWNGFKPVFANILCMVSTYPYFIND